MTKKKKSEESLRVKNIVVLCQLTDGTIHQAIITKQTQITIHNIMSISEPNGSLRLLESPISYVSWESDIDISKS